MDKELIEVKVMTFKDSGKYYDEWTIKVRPEKDEWFYIIQAIRKAKQGGVAPQRQFEWLIGYDDSRDDMYPLILRNRAEPGE